MEKGVIKVKRTAKFGHISRWWDRKREYEREKFVENKTTFLGHTLKTLKQSGAKDLAISSDKDHFIIEYTS